ncbi:hypothetical protein VC83_05845 [Pseudogymnoascus destructans]|uniref:Uncharacterized protein n=1 Tax=Pseudogymnoascus destructans TaxID=655981 RepID=A0A177A874_9PEZI|nr:uncharacterized protein VC83_05845 [Pseudogymnoascus destructans]OAF57234.1 hypothetical protein VC83_05845 [Pseudogymnoascus destructans]
MGRDKAPPLLSNPSNITLPTLQPNLFSLFTTNDAAPANNQSPFHATAQRVFPHNNTRLPEAGLQASIRANLGRAFDFAAPPRRIRSIQRLYFDNSPAPPPHPTNDSPSDPSNPPVTATEPGRASASSSSTTDSETSQQEREQQRQQHRLDRRQWRREDRQRQREIRRQERRENRQLRQRESDAQQRERWQRRAAAAHPNLPTLQALIVRSRETIRDERRGGRNRERRPEAEGPAAAFDLRFFGGRPPNTEAQIAQERARTDEAQAEAMAQEEMERLAAAGDPAAIASVRRRVMVTPSPPVGFGPGFVGIENVPGAEAPDADMGRGPEEIQDPAQQRAAGLAPLAARDAWMAERARMMGAGPQFERVSRERREKVERQKEDATREMVELLERMVAKKGRQEQDRWEGRGGGALGRLKTRLGESFGVLEGEVVLAHHAHQHHTDPTEALLEYTRAAARANAHAANKAANAMSVPPITITPAEKKEVQSAARAVALATEEARILSAIRPGGGVTMGGVTMGGVTGVIRQQMQEGQRVFFQVMGVRVVSVGEQVMDVPRVFMDAGGIAGEIERRNLEVDRMMGRLESQRAEVRRGMAELARIQEDAQMAEMELERDQAVDEAVEEMERLGAELQRRTAEVRRQGVELQRRRAEVDGRRMLERRRVELERVGREQARMGEAALPSREVERNEMAGGARLAFNEATEQEAEGRRDIAGAAERLRPEIRLTLLGAGGFLDAAADAGSGVAEGGQLEGARLEEAWRRLAAGRVEVLGEVVHVRGDDREGAEGGGFFSVVPDLGAGLRAGVVPVVPDAGREGRTAAGEMLRAQIDSLVVPEDVGERYQEALEMVQTLLRGHLADGEDQ